MIVRILLCLYVAAGAVAYAQSPYFDTSAKYACIMDADTGLILFGKNHEQPMIPASMTKIMTAMMVFERIADGRLDLDQPFVVSSNAFERGGRKSGNPTSFLELDSMVRVEDLLRGMIVQSGSDAAIALAEGIAGSEEAFARAMTKRAREMGLESASFTNATGLYSSSQRISAADIAELTRIMIERHPEAYKLFTEESFVWNGIRQDNPNPLLGKLAGVDGVNTGYLGISGYNIVTSVIRNGTRRIVVLNGLKTKRERNEEARRVTNAALEEFRVRRLVNAGSLVGEVDVYLGDKTRLPLIVQENAVIGTHLAAMQAMTSQIVYQGPLIAPIIAGQYIGDLVIAAPGQEEIRLPVIAAADIKRLNVLARAVLGLTGAR